MAVRDTSTKTRLPSRWLLPARTLWIGLATLSVIAYLAYLTIFLQSLESSTVSLSSILSEDYGVVGKWVQILYSICIPAGFVLTGVFIFYRRSDDWMAMLISYALVSMGTIFLVETEFYLASVYPSLRLPVSLLDSAAIMAFVLLVYLFPHGEFAPRWTRWFLYTFAAISIPVTYIITGQGALSTSLRMPIIGTLIVFLAVGLVSQVYRYRRLASPIQRQQMKWVIVGMASVTTSVLLWASILAEGVFGVPSLYSFVILQVFLGGLSLLMPVAFAVSILRYRLWDIDYVISRSLVYGALTLVLGALFLGGLFGIRLALQSLLDGDQVLLAVAVPAAAAVALFNPARGRLHRFIDHLYGIEIDYHQRLQLQASPSFGKLNLERGASLGKVTNLEIIGRGGMGIVYRGYHTQLDQPVAIKCLPEHSDNDEIAYRRFTREAQTIAQLDHPNIVRLHSFGVQDSSPYMVMEYVDGLSLSAFVSDREGIPLTEARSLLEQIASALDYAHQQGIIHRDIKPSNVMVTPGENGRWRAVLMDFGIAKVYASATRLTATGLMGTLDYMAPEQIQGAKDVDAQADIYSLGVMAYEMLTGGLPFQHSNPGAVVMAHLTQPPPDPREKRPDLPGSVAKAIVQAMAKIPEQRFTCARDFAAELA